MKRRTFLKISAAAAGAGSLGGCLGSGPPETERDDSAAILVDLTACGGCRTCELACAQANGLPEPDVEDTDALDLVQREASDHQFVVVNRHDTSRGEVYVRRQCMHCVEPACATACLTKALVKTPEGPVIWREDKCMGCRYCMLSCPFDVPKFEYASANPKIQKCQMCFARLGEGERPACVEECPGEALVFGKRSELIELARTRIYQNPDDYVPHIYGEHEAGGTCWLYLSPVAFEELGFPTNLDTIAYPEHTRVFLSAVPLVLTLWPAFLLALRQSTKRQPEADQSKEDEHV